VKESPATPPPQYKGKRVGDVFELNGSLWRVVELRIYPDHSCPKGLACKGRWQVLSRRITEYET
jgi:hypothetical protein